MYVCSPHQLAPYPEKITDRLDHWAAQAPNRTFLAQRNADGSWRKLSYADFRSHARNVAQSLLNRELSVERPIAILSGNDIEHALLGFGAMYAGLPYAPISPAYSLISTDFSKLRYIFDLLTPGLVFANGPEYNRALAAVAPRGAEIVSAEQFRALTDTPATRDVDAAHARVGPDTIAKILLTSGSTGMPKGVINTQRMWCANQEMVRCCLALVADEPPVILDWLPWNHTFGGNHNLGMIVYNGGSLYIDDGKPMPGAIEETVRNLREISTNIYFNVPKGYEALLPYFHNEPALRERFFEGLQVMFYAAASLSQPVWDAWQKLAVETCGERILMVTALGSTETAPLALFNSQEVNRAGMVGVPVPGVEMKLAPSEGKLEARLRGPNITPGYWRQPELTREAFDDEGFYKLGDALRIVDPADMNQGFLFDGRIAEDFKISTGTWVSVGPLRNEFLAHCAPYARDVVIAGHDRDYVSALIFPEIGSCLALCPDAAAGEVLHSAPVRAKFQALLEDLAKRSAGTSHRIARAILLEDPPSIDAHEITDKGSLNQRAVLDRRAKLVDELYSEPPSPRVIIPGGTHGSL